MVLLGDVPMIWLQNGITMLICFLLARVLTDHHILDQWLFHILGHNASGRRMRPDLFFLLIAWGLSIFLSNTVVVLSLLPMARMTAEKGESSTLKTSLGLALIFGANIGGMASLIGSPLNLAAATFMQMRGFPGAEQLTFFSWLLFGLPISLGLLALAWMVLRTFGGNCLIPGYASAPLSRNRRLALKGTVAILAVLLLVSALQFILSPVPVFLGLNWIDLFFLLILPFLLALLLFWPIAGRFGAGVRHNLLFLGASLLFLPFIALHQIVSRAPFNRFTFLNKVSEKLDQKMVRYWNSWFGKWYRSLGKKCRPDALNPCSLVSINRMLYDLPYLGFLLMAVVIVGFYLLMTIGDNPATARLDGVLPSAIAGLMQGLSAMVANPLTLVFIFILATIFLTELFNNTVVLFIAGPLLIQSSLIEPLLHLPFFLILTLAASAAFMSPIATPVNAIVATGLPGFSMRMMAWRGLWLNLLAVLWLFGIGCLVSMVL